MRKIGLYLEELFTEAALAEERETRSGGRISRRFGDLFDSLFMAITFAEAGEFGTAREILGPGPDDEGQGAGYCAAGFCAGRA